MGRFNNAQDVAMNFEEFLSQVATTISFRNFFYGNFRKCKYPVLLPIYRGSTLTDDFFITVLDGCESSLSENYYKSAKKFLITDFLFPRMQDKYLADPEVKEEILATMKAFLDKVFKNKYLLTFDFFETLFAFSQIEEISFLLLKNMDPSYRQDLLGKYGLKGMSGLTQINDILEYAVDPSSLLSTLFTDQYLEQFKILFFSLGTIDPVKYLVEQQTFSPDSAKCILWLLQEFEFPKEELEKIWMNLLSGDLERNLLGCLNFVFEKLNFKDNAYLHLYWQHPQLRKKLLKNGFVSLPELEKDANNYQKRNILKISKNGILTDLHRDRSEDFEEVSYHDEEEENED